MDFGKILAYFLLAFLAAVPLSVFIHGIGRSFFKPRRPEPPQPQPEPRPTLTPPTTPPPELPEPHQSHMTMADHGWLCLAESKYDVTVLRSRYMVLSVSEAIGKDIIEDGVPCHEWLFGDGSVLVVPTDNLYPLYPGDLTLEQFRPCVPRQVASDMFNGSDRVEAHRMGIAL